MVRVWDERKPSMSSLVLEGHTQAVTALDGPCSFILGQFTHLFVYPAFLVLLSPLSLRSFFYSASSRVRTLPFSSRTTQTLTVDWTTIATGSADRTVRLWSLFTGEPLGVSAAHGSTVTGIALRDRPPSLG